MNLVGQAPMQLVSVPVLYKNLIRSDWFILCSVRRRAIEMEVEGAVPSFDELSSKDQGSWAQCLLEASYFESCFNSPKGCFSPKLGELQAGAIPDLCPSPQLSDQLNLLHSWSSRTPVQQDLPAEEAVSMTSVSFSGSEASDTLVGSDSALESAGNVTGTRKRKQAPSDEDDESLAEEKNSTQKTKVKKPKRTKGPRYAIKTRSDVDIMDDGYKWRKYGQKPVKSSPHPRNYYRCTTANCPVRKRVERCTEDTGLVITSYEGTHSHPQVIQQKNNNSSGASTNHDDLTSLLNLLCRPAGASNLLPPFPPVPNLSHLWGSPLNFPGWPVHQTSPSAHDNMGLIMAYQLVKLQWELQARTQQFMDFSSQTTAFPDPEMMNGIFEPVQQFPQAPESSMGSSLLRKRSSAFRNGGPIPLDLQCIAKMQQLRAA